jgi:L-alanine-DL-glutamate epimerase-like enolase superfamily enzyme
MAGLQRPSDLPHLNVRQDVYPFDRAQFPKNAIPSPTHVVTVEIVDGRTRGRGEAVPYDRFGETIDEVLDTVSRLGDEIAKGLNRKTLQRILPPGAARSAVDCALWDFDAKRQESAVASIVGLGATHRLVTAVRLPNGSPAAMAARAAEETHRPLLKLDLGDAEDLDRIAAVHQAAPAAQLIVDAREAWTLAQLTAWMPQLAELGVVLLEQPLPAGQDTALAGIRRDVPISADESCYEIRALEGLMGRYDAVTIKLDKVGGLTAAMALMEAARDLGLRIAVSAPWCSSLGIAPAVLLAQEADWCDLDAPLFLARDRQPGLRYDGSILYPPNVSLWG